MHRAASQSEDLTSFEVIFKTSIGAELGPTSGRPLKISVEI